MYARKNHMKFRTPGVFPKAVNSAIIIRGAYHTNIHNLPSIIFFSTDNIIILKYKHTYGNLLKWSLEKNAILYVIYIS